jgi:hypothetical protein
MNDIEIGTWDVAFEQLTMRRIEWCEGLPSSAQKTNFLEDPKLDNYELKITL